MAIDANMKILCFCLIFVINSLPTRQQVPNRIKVSVIGPTPKPDNQAEESACWMNFNVSDHVLTIDRIDSDYSKVRKAFHNKVAKHLNSNMLKMMASKTIHNTGDPLKIPSGTKLGGNCMVWGADSIMVFSRTKLRNDTGFRINFFENDIKSMTLKADISLNDLRLVGAYERLATQTRPSIVLYSKSGGEGQVLLHETRYKMYANLRLQENRFVIESVMSQLVLHDGLVLMTLTSQNGSTSTQLIDEASLGDFIEKVKTDLDLWIKDYLNDYYTYFQLNEVGKEFKNYERFRLMEYNEYSNYIINQIKNRIEKVAINGVGIPQYTLFTVPDVQIKLKNGVIKGFDTIYKRSVATGRRVNNIRIIDMIVGFSNLKVEYQIEVGKPYKQSTFGRLQLGADDVTAHLQVAIVRDPDTVNLGFKYIEQLKPESLAVSGDAEGLVSQYKRLLETSIIAIMTNVLKHNVRKLGTLTRCEPLLTPFNITNRYSYINKYESLRGRYS